ncbi:MAG: hypothetical protein CM15mP74_33810 [Halieaceae bacterium]|nr:MAG: hypothetical protein CM15mP74_33810 [Halieaceae bacterium]
MAAAVDKAAAPCWCASGIPRARWRGWNQGPYFTDAEAATSQSLLIFGTSTPTLMRMHRC